LLAYGERQAGGYGHTTLVVWDGASSNYPPELANMIKNSDIEALLIEISLYNGEVSCNCRVHVPETEDDEEQQRKYESPGFLRMMGQMVGYLLGRPAIDDFKHEDWYSPFDQMYISSPTFDRDATDVLAPLVDLLVNGSTDDFQQLQHAARHASQPERR
jgi:hypothetical protein